jgi:uncharacterized metal-binding protein
MMQTDIKASVPLAATGQFTNQTPANLGRTRIKGVYLVCAAGAGSLVIRDGGGSGAVVATINTPASATATVYFLFPGEGLLCETNVHGTVTNVASSTIFYG